MNKKTLMLFVFIAVALVIGIFYTYTQKRERYFVAWPEGKPTIYKDGEKLVEINEYAGVEYYEGIYYWLDSHNATTTKNKPVRATDLYSFDPKMGRVKQVSLFNQERYIDALGLNPFEVAKNRGSKYGDILLTIPQSLKRIDHFIFFSIETEPVYLLTPLFATFVYDVRNETVSDSKIRVGDLFNSKLIRIGNRIIHMSTFQDLTVPGGVQKFADDGIHPDLVDPYAIDPNCFKDVDMKSINEDYPITRNLARMGGLNCSADYQPLVKKSDHEIYFSITSSTSSKYTNGLWSVDADNGNIKFESIVLIPRRESDFVIFDSEKRSLERALKIHPLPPEYKIGDPYVW